MGYDRQTSPFVTRLLLTVYCLFLLVNVLLYANNVHRLRKEKYNFECEYEIVFLGIVSILIFSINFYGIWFARIIILCFMIFLFSMLLGTTIISLLLIITNVLPIDSQIFLSLKTSIYFQHNYIWLIITPSHLLYKISLPISCLLNIFALCGTCHLCSCIEHRQQSWPYRKRSQHSSHTTI